MKPFELPYEKEMYLLRYEGIIEGNDVVAKFCEQCGGRIDVLNTCICGEMIHTKAGVAYLPARPMKKGRAE